MASQKGFIPILLLVGCLVLVIVGVSIYSGKLPVKLNNTQVSVSVTPSPANETADWKTYTNTKYNYFLKYPSDYSVKEMSPNYVRFFQGTNDPNMPQTETYLSIQLDINPKSPTDSNTIYKTTPDGKTLRLSQIIMGVEDSQKPMIQAVFNQILSTFKFLNEGQSESVDDWQTYTDSRNHYSIKYPSQNSGLAIFICEKGKTYGTLKYEGPNKFGLTEIAKVKAACWPGEVLKNVIEIVVGSGEAPKETDITNYPETELETNSITLDGVKGIEVTFTKISSAPYPQKWTQVFVSQGGRLYTLTFASSYNSVNLVYENIFNQLLSTFKFKTD